MRLSRFSLAAVGCAFIGMAAGAGPEKPVIPRATIDVTDQSQDQIVSDIIKAAREKWAAADLSPDLADKLAKDLTIVVRAYLKDDFDSVNQLWTQRGAKLGAWAAALADQELESGRYDEADAERLKTAGAEERLRYVWMHSAERGAKWEKVGTDHVRAGTKLGFIAGSAEWPPNGCGGMGSRWRSPADQKAQAAWEESNKTPPAKEGLAPVQSRDPAAPKKPGGWVSLQNKAQDGDIPAAFVQFPIKMVKGGTILWRMSFGYDPQRAAWYPLDLSFSVSDRGETRPLF